MILNCLYIFKGKLRDIFLAVILLCPVFMFAQVPNGYNEFKYPNGIKSSEGYFVDGRPEGFWKAYYENGNIKSAGNRLNNKLDSIWSFYDVDGILSTTIEYNKGKKDGWRKNFNKDSTLIKEELFDNDTLILLREYYSNGVLKYKVPFKNGEKFGKAFEYDTTGLERSYWVYSNQGTETFIINRLDPAKKRTGKWMEFRKEVLVKETHYSRGLKNGVERIFDVRGNLQEILKYSNGQLLKDVKELQKVEVIKELGSNGLIAKSGGYNSEGKPHGVHRKYDEKGEVESSKIYEHGALVGEGIVQKNGNKNGNWKLYYPSGKKLAEGEYNNGKKIGYWKFYYENGVIETEGEYAKNGKQDGLWKEYFESGKISEKINYYEGVYDGSFTAYNDSGVVIIQGKYKEDYEDSIWIYTSGDHFETGEYTDGLKTGEWKSYYLSGKNNKQQIVFKGSFENNLPKGEHLFWYSSGGLRFIGSYRSGRKSGVWTEYSEGGKVVMVTEYTDGLVRKLNGYKIDPAHEPEDYIEYNSTGYRN